VSEVGEVIARGRDTEIIDHGDGLVLRRPMVPRSMDREAAVMRWVHDQGYPCPMPHEVVDDGLVMARIHGVSMLDDLVAHPHPHRLRRDATLLADLHGWLHRLTVPAAGPGRDDDTDRLPDLPSPFGAGASLLHGDLHPGNVLLTADGPVVIDWTNAAIGPPGADLAVTWLLLAAAQPPSSPFERVAVAALRGLLVRAFLRATDRVAAARSLSTALEHRCRDANLSSEELASMNRIVARHGR
jgi:aminoglycoside phosphotransferase (APT) family kinase protein